MARRSERFPSTYLKAADFNGQEKVLTIAAIGDQEFENDGRRVKKPVISFMEPGVKPLVVNMTNYVEMENFLGPDDSAWIGGKIAAYSTMINVKGKVVETIRVRRPHGAAPAQSQTPPTPPPPPTTAAEATGGEIIY